MTEGTGVSQAVARPVRTFAQLIPSAIITEFIDAFVYNMDEKQYAALAAFLLLVISFLQVLIENNIGKGLLRNVPGKHVNVVEGNG